MIKDANNCTSTTTATINNIEALSLHDTLPISTCGNSNGSITATGAGGVIPYQYSINGTIFQASNVFSGLAAATYTVTIKDANNCRSTTTAMVNNCGGATVIATSTSASCGNSNG